MNKFLLVVSLFLFSVVLLLVGIVLTLFSGSKLSECDNNPSSMVCGLRGSYYKLTNFFRKDPKIVSQLTLTYWGLNIPETVIQPLLTEYHEKVPLITVKYVGQNYAEKDLEAYKITLKNRLKNVDGPDIFSIHTTWLNSYIDLVSVSNRSMALEDYEKRFYPIAKERNVSTTGEILAIPLTHDGLALFYNKDIFRANNKTVPLTWDELRERAIDLTIKERTTYSEYKIIRGGVALGEVSNVPYSTDVLGLLLNQTGALIPRDLATKKSSIAFGSYGSYQSNDQVWNSNMPNAINAFAASQVAMIFARHSDIQKLKELNPSLNYGIAYLPQLPTADGKRTNLTWASFYVESVSGLINEEKQKASWDFLVWLSDDDQQIKLRNEWKKYVENPPMYSSVNLNTKEIEQNVFYKAFLEQAAFSKTSVISDLIGNDSYAKLIKDGIIKLRGKGINDASSMSFLTELKDSFDELSSNDRN